MNTEYKSKEFVDRIEARFKVLIKLAHDYHELQVKIFDEQAEKLKTSVKFFNPFIPLTGEIKYGDKSLSYRLTKLGFEIIVDKQLNLSTTFNIDELELPKEEQVKLITKQVTKYLTQNETNLY